MGDSDPVAVSANSRFRPWSMLTLTPQHRSAILGILSSPTPRTISARGHPARLSEPMYLMPCT